MDRVGCYLILDRLRATNQPLEREAILALAEIKLPRVARLYEDLVTDMLERGEIQGNAAAFRLTALGKQALAAAVQTCSLTSLFYDEYFRAVRESPAHSIFCERVYGRDLHQHGMADMAQIELALDRLGISPGAALLDFGCGDGEIAEYIAASRQAAVHGVDLSPAAVEIANRRAQSHSSGPVFTCVDIETRPEDLPAGPFDAVLAIDSLFFLKDQAGALSTFGKCLKPGGKMGLFYVAPDSIPVGETILGKGLSRLEFDWEVIDLTAENIQHWSLKRQVLLELKGCFQDEGNLFLFRNRLAECAGWENMRRWLYLCTSQAG